VERRHDARDQLFVIARGGSGVGELYSAPEPLTGGDGFALSLVASWIFEAHLSV